MLHFTHAFNNGVASAGVVNCFDTAHVAKHSMSFSRTVFEFKKKSGSTELQYVFHVVRIEFSNRRKINFRFEVIQYVILYNSNTATTSNKEINERQQLNFLFWQKKAKQYSTHKDRN